MRTEREKDNRSLQRRSNLSSNQQRRGMKGRGPSSYVKSDERILEQINDRLCDNPYLDASEMVGINNGVVILTGTVNAGKTNGWRKKLQKMLPGWKMWKTDSTSY